MPIVKLECNSAVNQNWCRVIFKELVRRIKRIGRKRWRDGKERERIMRREQKKQTFEESWSRRKNAIKRGGNDYQPGPSETLQREKGNRDEAERNSNGTKTEFETRIENWHAARQTRCSRGFRFTSEILANYSLKKIIFRCEINLISQLSKIHSLRNRHATIIAKNQPFDSSTN